MGLKESGKVYNRLALVLEEFVFHSKPPDGVETEHLLKALLNWALDGGLEKMREEGKEV